MSAIILLNQTELEHVAERVEQAGIAAEQIEGGLLVRDPSQNGVLLRAP